MVVTKEQQKRNTSVNREEVVIQCAGLTKIFKDFWMRDKVKAVNGINVEVKRGEVFGLLGPNGSGKSTTIKMLLGLLSPSSGKISVFGKRPDDVAVKKNIGYLPEESFLYRFLNARETLDYYGRIFNLSGEQRNKRTDMLLEMVGLENMQRRPVGEYSKGMQRRIGLAQALINDPQLLILDEPTTGMDPIGTRQIKDLILSLRDSGKTVLLCSHLLADVQDVVDRAAIMYGGKICEYGTIKELTTDATGQTISLEQKFLEMVERERSKGTQTSGAQAGGRLAEFLGESDLTPLESAKRQAAHVIDDLVKPSANLKSMPDSIVELSPVDDAVDQSILDQLSNPTSEKKSESVADNLESIPTPVESAQVAGTNLDILDDLIVGGGLGEVTPTAQPAVEVVESVESKVEIVEPVLEKNDEVIEKSLPVDEEKKDASVIEKKPSSIFAQAMDEVSDYEGDDENVDTPVDTAQTNQELKPQLQTEVSDDEAGDENPDQSFIDALTDVDPEEKQSQ